MRILLVNDTSNNGHLGCSAVANALRIYLLPDKSARIYPVFNRQLIRDGSHSRFVEPQMTWFSDLLKWCDLVLINGEGTLHHGRAPELEVVMSCALESKRPFFVVNSILEDYPRIVPLLKQAAGVSLRDRLSLQVAQDSGVSAELCCDAALFAAFAPFQAPRVKSGTAATDWHGNAPAITELEMSSLLNEGEATFLPFRTPAAALEWPQVISRLAQYDRVVSGRYHGTLFSIMAGVPVTMLPSNSHKTEALAREYEMRQHHHDQTSSKFYSLECNDIAAAREYLIEQSSDRQLHPLRVLELGARRFSTAAKRAPCPDDACAFVDRSPSEREVARLRADEMKQGSLSLPRKHRLRLMERLAVPVGALKDVSELLLQEGFAEYNGYVKDALLAAGDEQAAFGVTLRSCQALPASVALRQSLAVMLARNGDHHGAHELFKVLDGDSPVSGHVATLAARSANRVGDYAAAFRYLARTLDEKKPESFVRAAAAASRSGQTEAARSLALRACENVRSLSEWPSRNTGNILASNGLPEPGFACMADALRRYDSTFSRLAQHCGNDGVGTAVYFPERFGVGSTMLALALMASRRDKLPDPLILILDPRLTSSARALLGPHTVCKGDVELDDLGTIARVTTVFDVLRDFAVGGLECNASFSPCRSRTEGLSAKLRDRFPGRRLYGLTWFTPNVRTGSGRNLALTNLRSLVNGFPNVQFVSLQPDNRRAKFDLDQLVAGNVYIEDSVDPLESIDDQLCLIASLDKVVGVDCSAIHFAGALGKHGAVLLTGEPTWQWPLRSSFYARIRTVRSLDELRKATAET